MKSENIQTIDDYIKFAYPEPIPESIDYSFFASWGYEQYLIKTYHYDLEQLRILLMSDYNNFRLSKFIGSDNPIEMLKNKTLVKAKKILHGFLMQSVPATWCGVLLWREQDKYFCIFPSRGNLFGQLIRLFDDSEVEITKDVFIDEADLLSRCDMSRISSTYELKGNVCFIPELGNVYVDKTWNNDCYHGSFSIDYTPATYDSEKKKWQFKKGKKNLIRNWSLDYSNVENAKICAP